MTQMINVARPAALSAVLLAAVIASHADAALVYSRLSQFYMDSTLQGVYPGQQWTISDTENVSDSGTNNTRIYDPNPFGAPSGSLNWINNTTNQVSRSDFYAGGMVDQVSLWHVTGQNNTASASANGSITVTFLQSVKFYSDSTANYYWNYNAQRVANGTQFAAGTYYFYYYVNHNQRQDGWSFAAYFAPVPAPGALALLGVAGLTRRRRRA